MKRFDRRLAVLAALPLALGAASCARSASADPVVTVYQSPACGCCGAWGEHLRENGFAVEVVYRADVSPVKHARGVPAAFASCHTAVVDGYVVEGHVPAEVIRRLLAERPPVKGIAVPGMPVGSPGMEQGGSYQPYEVYTFDENGPKDLFAAR